METSSLRNATALKRGGDVPKQVDHEERRQHIADAVCRLVGSQGLDAVTLRHVAAEAGVSMGRVQHYFATKDDMLLFAFHALGERVEQRIGASVAAVESPSARETLRALLMEMLPLDEHGRLEAPVWTAFLARAVVEPRLAAPLSEGGRQLTEFVGEQIRAAQRTGDAPSQLDPAREATALLAMMDGLMVHVLIGQVDTTAATATLDYHLGRIFTASPRTD
jgi:AcrR family transcriptional regulator